MTVPEIESVSLQVLDEIRKLQAIVANAASFVISLLDEDIEQPVQEGTGPAAEAEYHRKLNFIAERVLMIEELLIQLQAETSTTSIVGLNLRVKNTLKIQS